MLKNIYSNQFKFLQKLILTALLTMCVSLANSDDYFKNYQPLYSQGSIPDDFLIMYNEQYEQELLEAETSQNRAERKAQKDFILSSSYIINDMLKSGRVMFNDPVGQYVNRVADELLKNNQELRNKLRFYVVRSPSVNAFATNSGIIFINLGLIAQLENEAQLAFVLAHEIIHYQHNHVIDRYVEREKISDGRNQYRRASIDEKVMAQTNYSQHQELEADSEGFTEYYIPSSYSLNAYEGVFDVLRFSHLPFNEIPFNKSFFETSDYILPNTYFLDNVSPIDMDEDYDDSKSTHPNVKRRREVIRRIAEKHNNENRKNFILPQADFIKARDMARFECIRLFMGTGDYTNAIYNSYVILKDHPDNFYLKRSIAGSLYAIAKYKNQRAIRRVVPRYQNIEGQSQQLYHLFSTIDRLQLNVLALSYAWKLYSENPDDRYLKTICQDLVRDLVNEHSILDPHEHFYDKGIAFFKEKSNNGNTEEVDDANLSKYDRIRQQSGSDALDPSNYYRFALVNAMQDSESELIEFFEYYKERHLTPQQKRVRDRERKDERFKENRANEKKGRALGIENIVVVDPFYVRLDERVKDGIRYMRSAGNQKKTDDRISNSIDMIDNLSATILNPRELESNDAEMFNDISDLKFWFSERMKHDDFWIASSEYPFVEHLIEKYGTEYFNYPGVISVRIKKQDLAMKIMFYLFTVYLAPLIIYEVLNAENVTFYYNILFDLRKGTVEYAQTYLGEKRDRNDILNNLIYGSYNEISRKK